MLGTGVRRQNGLSFWLLLVEEREDDVMTMRLQSHQDGVVVGHVLAARHGRVESVGGHEFPWREKRRDRVG